jgi:UDP-N-acetylmuramoyl-L-alanyl-D-glutamate--2,6-diaminopimelate ligase
MHDLPISEIATLLGGAMVNASLAGSVATDVCASSETVTPGAVFVAVRGHVGDGHSYVHQAFSKGALLAVVEDAEALGGMPGIVVKNSRLALSRLAAFFNGDPSTKLRVIGITGTNGKTTTNWIIYHVLNSIRVGALRIGTLGTECMGEARDEGTLTSPDPISLHAVMRQALDMGAKACVMETSSHALDQARVEDVQFDVGVFTNLTRDHLDYHRTFDHYFQAKSHLFTLLHGGDKKTRGAVINIDDPYGAKLFERTANLGLKDLSFGRNARAQFRILRVTESPETMEIRVEVRDTGEEFVIHAPFIGPHNAENVVAALAAIAGLGHTLPDIVGALRHVPQVPGRLERIGGGSPRVFVDYAHTPDALERVLRALRVSTEGRLWCVFGCGGDRDRGKRPEMARIAAAESDYVVITSDNPRTEDPQRIIGDILSSGISAAFVDGDRAKAIRHAITAAGPRDTVLISGKGHENYQIIGTNKIHFSDQEACVEALSSLG